MNPSKGVTYLNCTNGFVREVIILKATTHFKFKLAKGCLSRLDKEAMVENSMKTSWTPNVMVAITRRKFLTMQ